MKKVVEPQGEARNDFDIFADISEQIKAGGRDVYTESKSEMDWLKGFYETAQKGGRAARVRMPSFGKLWETNELIEIKFSKKAAGFVRHADFRKDPVMNPLSTPSGKIEIYSKTIEGYGYEDCPPHPTCMEPTEFFGSAKDGELFISPH